MVDFSGGLRSQKKNSGQASGFGEWGLFQSTKRRHEEGDLRGWKLRKGGGTWKPGIFKTDGKTELW